ncbi:MAG TPA: hypothetical protein VF746_32140 [Longimicrobium sp.]|jgi:hypothetical protein
MSKIRLDVDALRVDSFAVEPGDEAARGTVDGYDTGASCLACPSNPYTCDETCPESCGCPTFQFPTCATGCPECEPGA